MSSQRTYKGTIWTNHALERLRERRITQSDAWVVWRNPDSRRFAESKGAWVYYKTWGTTRYEVVAKQNNKGEWIILSVWSKNLGEKSSKPRQSFISKLRNILGI